MPTTSDLVAPDDAGWRVRLCGGSSAGTYPWANPPSFRR
jgi:hypothetical protein